MSESSNGAPAGAPTTELSDRLMEHSNVIHREAERRPFMVQFLKAQLPQDAYAEWLVRQSFIYEALEKTDTELKDHPVVGVMYSPELHRTAAIDADLKFLIGDDWKEKATITPAVQDYLDRIEWARDNCPPAWVVHQWLRYMGNMLGQEVLRNILNRAHGLTEEGTNFFRYTEVENSIATLRAWKSRFNAMELTDAEQQAVVEEGVKAFELNIALTDELGRDFGIGEFSKEETEAVVAKAAAEHP